MRLPFWLRVANCELPVALAAGADVASKVELNLRNRVAAGGGLNGAGRRTQYN